MEEGMKFRHNAMNIATISTFESIKGGCNHNCKDVYFVRAIGTNATYLNDIQKLDDTLLRSMNAQKGYYQRISELPKLQQIEDASFYAGCYVNWLDSNKKQMITKITQTNKLLTKLMASACVTVEALYLQENKQTTDSMLKNFMVKLLYWYDSLLVDEKFYWEKFHWNEKESLKIVATNIQKKQEYLFFYFLTLMGMDVLLLQSKGDIGAEEEKLGLSQKFVLGDYSDIVIPQYQWHDTQSQRTPAQKIGLQPTQSTTSGTTQAGSDSNRITIQIPRRERPGRSSEQNASGFGSTGNPSVRIPLRPERERNQSAQVPSRPEYGRNQSAQVSSRPEHERNQLVQVPSRPERERNQSAQIPSRPMAGNVGNGAEKSFEELAKLASSVVLIEIYDGKGERMGSGSGIMIGRDGYILTNNHVACGGKYYIVRIEEEEREYKTDEVIKYNSLLDLAVIRIQRKLNPIPVYKGSKPLVRGQKVVAIGSPLGLFNSVSDGIISGFRQIENVDMIQFTAPISRGSSGGAVLNMQGEVIGISTAGIDSGQNINLAMGYECINMFIQGFV